VAIQSELKFTEFLDTTLFVFSLVSKSDNTLW